jgi:hypothetical protein
MKTPIVYKIAGNLRCLLVDNGQKISIGRAPECDVQIDGEEVHEVEATLQFVQDCNYVSISPASGTAAYEQPLPWTLPLGGFDLVFYRPSNPDKGLEKGATHEITLQGVAPEKLRRVLKPDRPLLLGSNADCDVVICSGDCPPVQLALWAARDNKVVVLVLDNSSAVDWLGRGEDIEAEMELPISLTLGGKMVLINKCASSYSQPMSSPTLLVSGGPPTLVKSAPPPVVANNLIQMSDYYIAKDGQQSGPFSKDDLIIGLRNGRFKTTDLAWQVGAADWVPLSSLFPPPPPDPSPLHQPVNHLLTAPPDKESGCSKVFGCAFICVVGFIGLAIIGAIFGDSKSSSDTGKTEADSSVVRKEYPPCAVGESFSLGGFSYVIVSARKTGFIGSSDLEGAIVNALIQGFQKETGTSEPSDGSNFLVVRYRIKNEGKESAVVSTSDFKVLDSKGRQYTPSSDATAHLVMNQDADFLLSELQPGIGRDGVQAFELPNDAFDGGLTLIVPEKGLFSSGEVRVRLGL